MINIMKNKPVLRWVLIGLIHAVLSLFGYIICIPIYPFRTSIRGGKSKGYWFHTFLWWFLNDTIEGRDAGDYGRYTYNFKGYYRQCANRNSHWNFRMNYLIPEIGKMTNIINNGSLVYSRFNGKILSYITLCNTSTSWGFQNITFKINRVSYFRYSFTYKIWFFGIRALNCQLGINDKRYLYKFKIPKIKQD